MIRKVIMHTKTIPLYLYSTIKDCQFVMKKVQ